MFSARRQEGDGLTGGQKRWLLLASVGLGALLLVLVLGMTAASHYYGVGDGVDGPPEAAFSVEPVEHGDGVAANVTHRGGHAIHPSDVVVEVDGERRGNWSALGGEGVDIVAPGHSLLVTDLEPGQEVRVLWIGDEESGSGDGGAGADDGGDDASDDGDDADSADGSDDADSNDVVVLGRNTV